MTPQPLLIYGTPCVLKPAGSAYAVTRRDTGAVLTEQSSRFLAVAKAAEVLRQQRGRA